MMKKKDAYTVAVVGATSAAGRELIELLEERRFPVADLVLLEPAESEGERIEFQGKGARVRKLEKSSFAGIDFAWFCTDASLSKVFCPIAAAAGAVVIDGSDVFRMDPAVPLVIPEVNADALTGHKGIIANPDSSVIALSMVLKPLQETVTIKRVVVTALQSVSSSGKEAMDELAGQTVSLMNFRDVETNVYRHQIAFNCIPQVDAFREDGDTRGEATLAEETKKILGDQAIRVTATAVWVPVFRGHALSVNIETDKPVPANEARESLARSAGVIVYDDPARDLYPLQTEIAGKDEVFVGRVREDRTVEHGLNLWIVCDNIRKGAALNAVQIGEHLIR